ncbi:hypothetical protein L21SP3_00566 [Sedimentisphaera cyanobacteriorum]|uniref:LarA-like N-terminal domain-containing protein n=1 Tax=Sedimentisphaera cyanobacteriorum TaxID=1940790 RepID=A0A1Q2HNH7_9BACT|nr:lactate racemase domain-containing protein [Sedimentisphaera cyanobacteriorum]AQQ08776.1 hypothetical protein L21SP3_00566 [Sedimentisphaera cyanobacteriorum]
MLYSSTGSENTNLSGEDLRTVLYEALDKLSGRKRVLVIPPDNTRFYSRAGELTRFAWEYYGDKLTDILPALGTHNPMTAAEIKRMFGDVPKELFRVHNWREDITALGHVPSSYISDVSGGRLNFDWPAQVNKLLVEGGFDLILSIGQVVPHEVIGMANYNKNIFVGTGGAEGINKSHYLGAVYGMERIMGKAENPVRSVLNYASENFAKSLPVVYAHTVIEAGENGNTARGLFVGDDEQCFHKAAELAEKVNVTKVEKPLKKAVVLLEADEYKSTWLGNKAIYRTRMAMADGGELIILAPSVKEFGEDKQIDKLIRKYGYTGTPNVLEQTEKNSDLSDNLSAAAHLIHGSSEGRFNITYCPGGLTREEIESVNFRYASLDEIMRKYSPEMLKDGFNNIEGEEVYFISNPGLGLWKS